MKLVCINNIHHEDRLTIGKVYEFTKMTSDDDSAYLMIDDNGNTWPFIFDGGLNKLKSAKFSSDRWVSLEDYRDSKLNVLGL